MDFKLCFFYVYTSIKSCYQSHARHCVNIYYTNSWTHWRVYSRRSVSLRSSFKNEQALNLILLFIECLYYSNKYKNLINCKLLVPLFSMFYTFWSFFDVVQPSKNQLHIKMCVIKNTLVFVWKHEYLLAKGTPRVSIIFLFCVKKIKKGNFPEE